VTTSDTYLQVDAPTATAVPYGSGCAGSQGEPLIDAQGVPSVGNLGFATRITAVPQGAVTLLAYGSGSVSVPLSGTCTQLIGPVLAADLTIAGDGGVSTFPLAIPPVPAFLGYQVFEQGVALDPAVTAGFVVTRGLQIQVGNGPRVHPRRVPGASAGRRSASLPDRIRRSRRPPFSRAARTRSSSIRTARAERRPRVRHQSADDVGARHDPAHELNLARLAAFPLYSADWSAPSGAGFAAEQFAAT
jgi:hypothetical protein